MTRPWVTTLGLVALALFAVEPGAAQTSSGGNVFGAGGGSAEGQLTRLHATAGQPVIGISGAARQGFWHTLRRGTVSGDAELNPVTGISTQLRLLCAPNPSSGSTNITVDIPSSGHVRLRIFDVNGRQVRTLIDEERTSGAATVVFDAAELPSGIYTAELVAGGQRQQLSIMVSK